MLAEKAGTVARRTESQPQVKRKRRRRQPGEERELVLRTTCDNCTNAKVKCNGEQPCLRCENKNIQCDYTYKKPCGPKRRKNLPQPRSDAEGLLASCEAPLAFDDHLRGMAVVLGKDELECVRVFLQNVNTFLPMTTIDTVTLAATPKLNSASRGSCGSADESQDEEADKLNHARKALLYGAIAVGADFLGQREVSATHANIAHQEMKECFDAVVPELVGAYLVLTLYWMHQTDDLNTKRYVGLARQSNGIIADPSEELVASLMFISVVLYDSKVLKAVGCRVLPPEPRQTAGSSCLSTPAALQSRVLKILSFVLLSIHNGPNSSTDPAVSTERCEPDALEGHVNEAKVLLEEGVWASKDRCRSSDRCSDISRCLVAVLQAYFLLLKNDRRQAVEVTEPIAFVVGDNPLILHLPIVWSMVGCVRSLLESADRQIAVERLQSAMDALASRPGFSPQGSKIERELMSVFVPKRLDRDHSGGTTAAQPPFAGPENVFLRSKAQTSSLNVTANYAHDSGPVNFVYLEPSPAPRRRALPSSVREHTTPGAEERLPSSLIPAVMSPAAAPMLASAAPPSRAGALVRAAATRGSLSMSAAFERSGSSMVQLDMPQTAVHDFAETSLSDAAQMSQSADLGHPGVAAQSRSDAAPSSAAGGEAVEVKPETAACIGDSSGDAEALEDSKPGQDRRELFAKQKVQPSFRADAPVSLEQVDQNMKRLGVEDPDPVEKGIVTSLDAEKAAELIASKTSSSFMP